MPGDSFQVLHFPVVAAVGPVCSTAHDGIRVNQLVQAFLNQGYMVKLDFQGVRLVTPSFYNAAVGELRCSFPESRLSIINMPG
jgi:hypothetical protein